MSPARAAVVALGLVLAALGGGCNRTRPTHSLGPLAITLHGGASAESFQRLMRTAVAHQYRIVFSDVRFGVFGVEARATIPRSSEHATFVVQCYADGHAVLTTLGPAPLHEPAGIAVLASGALRREAVALAQALEQE